MYVFYETVKNAKEINKYIFYIGNKIADRN